MKDFDTMGDFKEVREQLEKIFAGDFLQDVFQGLPSSTGTPAIHSAVGSSPFEQLQHLFHDHYPKIDLYQTERELVALCEMPGIERSEDVRILVEGDRLMIKGEAHRHARIEEEQFLITECHRGSFERELVLPIRVVAKNVKATYRLGVLEIRMRKEANEG